MSEFEDKAAIAEQAGLFSAAANRRSARDMERTLMPDAVLGGVAKLTGQPDEDVRGARAIGDLFAAAFETLDIVHQVPRVVEVYLHGDRATATTALVEHVRGKGGPLMLLIGDYEDELVRTSNGWRFTKRVLRLKSFAPVSGA